DPGEEQLVVWWADSPDVDGLFVSAPTLPELGRLIDEAATLYLSADQEIAYLLVPDVPLDGSEPIAELVPEDFEPGHPAPRLNRGPAVLTRQIAIPQVFAA